MSNQIKFRKNKEKFNPRGSVYDILLDGEKIGIVLQGRSHPGYWGAWKAQGQGKSVESGTRQDATEKFIQLIE